MASHQQSLKTILYDLGCYGITESPDGLIFCARHSHDVAMKLGFAFELENEMLSMKVMMKDDVLGDIPHNRDVLMASVHVLHLEAGDIDDGCASALTKI